VPQLELAEFVANVEFARNALGTAEALALQLTSIIDTSDLLRFSLVQGVSAFDHYVHEEVRTRMIQTQQGLHPRAAGFERFKVPLSSVGAALADRPDWLAAEVLQQHAFLSFQQPDKVADAFRLVTDQTLWDEVGRQLRRPAKDVKLQLKLIVDRRNKIVHEADVDPTRPRTRYAISASQVGTSLDFLEDLVRAIDAAS